MVEDLCIRAPKVGVLFPLEGGDKRRKANINPIFMYIQYEIHYFG